MSIITLEQNLTTFFAGALGLTADNTIFRGSLPGDKNNALGVLIESPMRGNGASMDNYSVQLLGRYLERDAALALCDIIDSTLPYYSGALSILKVGSPVVYKSTWNGKDVWGISANLEVHSR